MRSTSCGVKEKETVHRHDSTIYFTSSEREPDHQIEEQRNSRIAVSDSWRK